MKTKTYTLQNKFTFGKYRGLTIQEVLSKDAEYINWCETNIPGFSIQTSCPTQPKDADYYTDGIEILKRNPWTKRFLEIAKKLAEEAVLAIEVPQANKCLQLELQFA